MALKVLPGLSFAERTTLRLGGRSQVEIVVTSPDDAHGLAGELKKHASRPFVLGHGSNLLVREGELDLAVITLAKGEPVAVNRVVRAPGGMMLPKLVMWAAAHGFSGLEGLAGIPGTVGGAVAMNAGSFGSEMADNLSRVHLWDMASGARWITQDALGGPGGWSASYRAFAPRGVSASSAPWIVLEAELALATADPQAVRAATDEVLAKKKATQPVSAATCGCAFKNPPDMSAGQLLDVLGFRGKRAGGMAFSPMHANFLVNNGGGTPGQALALIDEARLAVRENFDVELELEVRVVE